MPIHKPTAPGSRGFARLAYGSLATAAAATIVVMLVAGNANIVLRWITGRQLAGSGELLVVLLPVAVFLALPAAERAGANVRSTALTDRLPPVALRIVTGIGLVISVSMAGLLFAATTSRAVESTTRGEQLVGVRTLPVWPSRIAVAVGLALLVLALLGQFVRLVRERDTVPPPTDQRPTGL